jgi:hypothetical protein
MKKQTLKLIFVTLICILFVLNNYAQTWQWAKQIGGSGFDLGASITTDKSGNVYVTGSFSDNLFIAKYDSSGTCHWTRKATGGGESFGYSITTDKAGNIYITGHYTDWTTFGINHTFKSLGSKDIFIAKYDSSGTCLWVNRAGGSDASGFGNSITIDGSGEVYVTGGFTDTIAFGNDTIVSAGDYDIFIAKYDSSGTCLWVKRNGGNKEDYGTAINTDTVGILYLTGNFKETATFGSYSLTSSGKSDVFIAKYDSTGNCFWVKKAGGSGDDKSYSITTDFFGNFYITGFFENTATFGNKALSALGNPDIFVAKYYCSGACLWVKRAGGALGTERGVSITSNNDGNIYLIGCFSGTADFGIFTLTSTSPDIFIAKYDTLGNCRGVTSAGGGGFDDGRSITIDPRGTIYITGYFSWTAKFDSSTLITFGVSDIFIAKLSSRSPPVIINPGSSIKCLHDSLKFRISIVGKPFVNYQWKKNGAIIPNANDSILTFSNISLSDTGNYYCVVTNVFGSDSSNVAKLEISLVTAGFTVIDSSQCFEANNFTFIDNSNTNIGTIQKTFWDFGDLFTSTTSSIVNHHYHLADTFKVKLIVTSSYGCIDSLVKFVYVLPMPVVDLGPDTTITDKQKINLDAGAGMDDYLWSNGSESRVIAIDTTGYGIGTFIIWVKVTKNACEGYDSIRITFTKSGGIMNPEEGYLRIFPNPATEMININCAGLQNIKIEIFNTFGECVLQKVFNSKTNVIDISSLSKGIYVIKITGNNLTLQQKLIKE